MLYPCVIVSASQYNIFIFADYTNFDLPFENFTIMQTTEMKKLILYCDAETIMRRYNNVEVSQCVLFDREKTIRNCFPIVFLQGKQNDLWHQIHI